MPCYRPLSAKYHINSLGKGEISFGRTISGAESYEWIDLPCGQCIGCRLERSRRWAVRITHEKSLHEKSSFLTLTYDDAHVPKDGSLKVEDFQLFMKRLRRGSSAPLRFFHCGEYGETNGRPHYHCILFGEDFAEDRSLADTTERGDQLYESPRLSEVWGMGRCWIGEVTFESAAYVARYCLKKVTGENAEAHYGDRRPEYVTMSRRPGIGGAWFDKWVKDTYPSDSVVMRGKEMMPPPYYDKLLEKIDPELFARIKRERKLAGKEREDHPDNRTMRLIVREKVKEETAKQCLRRRLE